MQRGKLQIKRDNRNAMFQSIKVAPNKIRKKKKNEFIDMPPTPSFQINRKTKPLSTKIQKSKQNNTHMSRQTEEGHLFLHATSLLPGRQLHGDGRRSSLRSVPARLHRKWTNLQARNHLRWSTLFPWYFCFVVKAFSKHQFHLIPPVKSWQDLKSFSLSKLGLTVSN